MAEPYDSSTASEEAPGYPWAQASYEDHFNLSPLVTADMARDAGVTLASGDSQLVAQ